MTDEEMADKYVKEEGFRIGMFGELDDITSSEANKEIKQAFLAGRNTGRLKWHKVADGDLPNNCRYVWTNEGAGYYDGECWRDAFSVLQGVVAWCEPKFEETKE